MDGLKTARVVHLSPVDRTAESPGGLTLEQNAQIQGVPGRPLVQNA